MELLAPCSSIETFYAAINAGADAIYLGGKNFSARAYAPNFEYEEIKFCIDKAHELNVKVYITVNTLLFEDEFDECFQECEKYIALGSDALIIQDIGLIYKLHLCYPNYPLHASTQLNVHDLKGALALKKLGVKRIVLARESNLSLAKEISEKLHLEVEIFVHGALCVSCSGQCLMSSFIGNRSGNRGRCAQPCRLEGKIIKDDQQMDVNYPLSMKDLCTLEELSKIKNSSYSLKIEGRMKSAEYIYHTVKAYKEVLTNEKVDLKPLKDKLLLTFNRGYTKGFLFDEKRNMTLNQNSSSHLGKEIGKVTKVTRNSFYLKLIDDLSLHDGLRDLNANKGFLLTHFKINGKDVHFASKGNSVEIITKINNVKINDVIVKTKSEELQKELQQALRTKRFVNLEAYFYAHLNEGMVLTLMEDDLICSVKSEYKLTKSKTISLSKAEIEKILNKSMDYPFKLTKINFEIEEGLFYPLKEINELRRNAYQAFSKMKIEKYKNLYKKVNYKESFISSYPIYNEIASSYKEEQLKILIKYPFSKIYVPSELYIKYHALDTRISLLEKRMGKNLGEDKSSLSPYLTIDSKILSSYGNITNHEAYKAALKSNYEGVILSYELNFEKALSLKKNLEKENFPHLNIFYPIYVHIEYMLLKSCMVSSLEKTKEKCGLCKKHQYFYQDRLGINYPLIFDNECYTKILSPLPLSLIKKKKIIKENFIPYFSFTIEDEKMVEKVLNSYFFDQDEDFPSFEGHFYKSPL